MIALLDRNARTLSGCGITFQARGDDPQYAFPFCRLLVAAGFEDEPLYVHDERGHAYTVSSIHAGARSTISETQTGMSIRKWKPFPVGRYRAIGQSTEGAATTLPLDGEQALAGDPS